MCGISGYINLNNKPLVSTKSILNMLREQKHRGPDDSGVFAFSLRTGTSTELPITTTSKIDSSFEGVLGFNRLSILDLSINGHQPMISPEGKVLLALNGEIYNAFDYKKELQEYGYRFKSTSDTEVVLAMYLRYGIDGMLLRLNGMFAIAIVDLSQRKLLIIRDRFGIKPMYYIINKNVFAFSSEIKSFFHLEDFSFKLDYEQLDEYLLFRNNLKGTLYKDIHSLAPGDCLVFTPDKGCRFTSYFDINKFKRSDQASDGILTHAKRLVEYLGKSVKSQLMSDVKLGCQLSGGIDSSLVTLLANANAERGSFEAVSIIFNNDIYNEEKYINLVADQLGIVSHKFLLESDYYLNNIEKATWHLEAPLNHPNTVAIYKLSQQAKEYVTVLLSGEGADEVFGGYDRFHELCYPFKPRRLIHKIRQDLLYPDNIANYFDPELRAIIATSFIRPGIAKKLMNGFNWSRAIENRRLLYRTLNGSLFDRQVKYEIKTYLPDLLIRQDKMSMAHSIENRVPFLDNEVVNESFSIPEKFLLPNKISNRNIEGKYILKKISADFFGYDFAFRNKMGFGIPVREFFSNPKFLEYLNDKVLPGFRRRGIFNYELVSVWISNIKTLKGSEIEALWLIVAFEIWASRYLDRYYENRHT